MARKIWQKIMMLDNDLCINGDCDDSANSPAAIPVIPAAPLASPTATP
ncbi:MAG: hypothetical protein RL215_1448 [Planctomycetota bacterium]